MSLNKAIASGKEYRKSYRGSAACDRTCRPNGSCDYCRSSRLRKDRIQREDAVKQIKEVGYDNL